MALPDAALVWTIQRHQWFELDGEQGISLQPIIHTVEPNASARKAIELAPWAAAAYYKIIGDYCRRTDYVIIFRRSRGTNV